MKNLKKVLALGLALVMLLGMFTVVSAAEDKKSASDLTDWDTVAHKDAVSLMVDLGIINGMPDGSFAPTGNIDRASWAKMVYYAATGSDDADAYLGTATGLNDIAGNWAESYISFLKASGFISGDNLGNYHPSNNVTVAEACKMMLTVLGYDATDRGYQNNDAWSGNIMNDAKRNGLMDNVDKGMTALVPLTRENAAEIVLNALNANMVEGVPQWDGGNRYITSYSKLYTLGYDVFNMVKVTATVVGIDTNGYANFADVRNTLDQTCTITTGNLDGKVKASANMVGETVSVYVKTEGARWDATGKTGDITTTGNFQSVISSNAAKASDVPVKTITGGIARWLDLTTRGTSNYVATSWSEDSNGVQDTAFYLNGETSTEAAVQTAAARRGTVVEFYTDTDGAISVVKAYYYTVGQVTNGDAQTKTLSDGTLQVRVPGIVSSWTDSDKVTGWQGLVEDDVVLYYRTALGNNTFSYTLEKAEKVTGKVTSFSTAGELTINGQKYKGSEQPGSGTIGDVGFDAYDNGQHQTDAVAVFGSWTGTSGYTLTDEYDFFLDKNGAIVVGIQVTESLDQSKVCLVIETEVVDKAMGASGSLRANLLFVDGSTEIVNVTKVNKMTVVDTAQATIVLNGEQTKKINSYEAQALLSGGIPKTTSVTDADQDALKKFFNYKATSTGYELVNLETDTNNWEQADALGNGSTAITTVLKAGSFAKALGEKTADSKNLLAGWNITADSTTTFIVGKVAADETVTYSVYKGFKNVPAMDASRISAICAHTRGSSNVNTTAKYVYLQTGTFKDDVPDGYIFIMNNSATIDPELADDEVYLIDIIDTDGTQTTMRVDSDLKDDITGESMILQDSRKYVGNFWAIGDIDENAVVHSLVDENESDAKAVTMDALTGMGNNVITTANDSWDYDSATVFVYVDMGWVDGTKTSNRLNVRDIDQDDEISFSAAGTFNPQGFYNEKEVGGTNDDHDGFNYESVDVAVVCPLNSTTADYVYVLRTLW